MAIRLSGIASGLDTDSMVKELVSAYSIKKQKYDKQLQKQEWIMSKWSDVNKKVYGFYSGTLSSMRLSGEYGVKTTSISRSEVAAITASSSAVVGSQTLSVKQLAASGYPHAGLCRRSRYGARLCALGNGRVEDIESGAPEHAKRSRVA